MEAFSLYRSGGEGIGDTGISGGCSGAAQFESFSKTSSCRTFRTSLMCEAYHRTLQDSGRDSVVSWKWSNRHESEAPASKHGPISLHEQPEWTFPESAGE